MNDKIIINADDFGLEENCSLATAEAFKRNLISSTTALANGEYIEEAVKLSVKCGFSDRIGIHVNLTEGVPLTENIKKDPFFCNNGVFHNKINRYKRPGKLQIEEMKDEIRAQIKRLKDLGVTFTHADSHHHIHNGIFLEKAIKEVLFEFGIKKIRLHRNFGKIKLYKRAGKKLYNIELKKQGFITTDRMGSFKDLRDKPYIAKKCFCEIMVHPGFDKNGNLIDITKRSVNEISGPLLDGISEYTKGLRLVSFEEVGKMRILYGYSYCNDNKYEELLLKRHMPILQPAQKYHELLIEGLSEMGADVRCFSGLPINRRITKRFYINEKDELYKGASYHYYKTLNFKFLRQLGIYSGAKKAVKKNADKNTVILCDCLNIANAHGMLKGAKKTKTPIIFIVTDLPDMLHSNKMIKRVNNSIFKKADGFIFLTEQMNERLNINNKPYIVLEGHVDSGLKDIEKEEHYEYKNGKKIIIYAGSIQKLYGIQNLVEGFINAKVPNTELHIYGDGDYREELLEVVKTNKEVKYMGIRPNSEIVFEEQRAALLINPRPIAPEYTKYSFPSKNMEYMVSATPVMTTKLPGMPKEYNEFVYLIEKDDAIGIEKSLKEFFAIPKEERYQKGASAREFVLKNKSNIVQAQKIIEFIKREIKVN